MRNAKDSTTPRQSLNNEPTPCETVSSAALEKLREQWDTRLGCLDEPGAADRLASVMKTPCRLDGKVIAGKTF
jgi:hypothetical protein